MEPLQKQDLRKYEGDSSRFYKFIVATGKLGR